MSVALTVPAFVPRATPSSDRPSRIDELIGEWATRAPETPAVTAADGLLSYADIERRATEWAMAYADQGVGPGSVVALSLPRSAALITAALGALKVGAAYLP